MTCPVNEPKCFESESWFISDCKKKHRFTKLVREVKHNSQNLNLQNNNYIYYIGSNSKWMKIFGWNILIGKNVIWNEMRWDKIRQKKNKAGEDTAIYYIWW